MIFFFKKQLFLSKHLQSWSRDQGECQQFRFATWDLSFPCHLPICNSSTESLL